MKKNYSAIFVISLSIVSLLIIASWKFRQDISDQFRQDAGNSLQTLLSTTQQALHSWQRQEVQSIMVWASSPESLDFTNRLLSEQQTPQALIDSPAQKEMRNWLNSILKGKKYLGYFIISKDNISLASSRDTNIGTINLLTQQPGFLQDIWAGQGRMSQPMYSDVTLQGRPIKDSHSMFVGAPIRDKNGKVIAAMTFRIDPEIDFYNLLQMGRMGKSGETYAFSREAILLSKSRFDTQLRNIGLVESQNQGVLDISIRVPGVKPEQAPLTFMAKQAIAGIPGIQLEGYLDYRGEMVIGAWLWDQQLDIGLATEMNIAEAYSGYYRSRNIIDILTILAVMLIAVLATLLSWLIRKNEVSGQQRMELLRQQKDFELSEASSRQEMILESTLESVVTINPSGEILFINSAALKLFGYQKEEILGQNVKIFVPEPHKSKHDSYLKRYLETGIGEVMQHGREVDGIKKDGRLFALHLSLTDITVAGERIFMGFIHDLTKLKTAQEKLEVLSRAVEQSPSAVIITNPAGLIEYVNPRFHEMTGYSSDEVIGQTPRILKSGHTSRKQYKELWKTIKSGNEWQGEFKNVKKNGEFYWEHAVISPVKNSAGEITHFLGNKENITERKRTQEELHKAKEDAEQANRTKSEFLANMSHEIRTPLNGIIGMTHLLSSTELEPKQQNYAAKINSSSKILLGLVNDVLDFSKIEAGKLDIESVEFELDQILADISNIIAFKAEDKSLELLFDVDPLIPCNLRGDPLRLNQVLLNLISNAVKFTNSGEVIVKIRSINATEKKLTLEFSVSDTGIGLSEEQVDKLFSPFTQVDSSTTRKFGGTGLGLSICKKLVELMNGNILVTSEINKGSCFQFTADFMFSKTEEKFTWKLPLELKNLRILVVDDSQLALEIMKFQLISFGFSVEVASGGYQALEILNSTGKDNPFQLVIMDWKMPELNGLETARLIKESEQISVLPLIIMHSIIQWDSVKLQAEKFNIDGYLSKPVNRSILFDTIINTCITSHQITHITMPENEKPESGPITSNYQILLAEDNEINQEVAKELLENNGFQVTIANNGVEVMDLLGKIDVDLILMDIQMPEMDGFETSNAIRLMEKYQDLPIVAMTANAFSSDRERCLDAGMNDHIAKPIDPNKLISTLHHFLQFNGNLPQLNPAPIEIDEFTLNTKEFDIANALDRLGGNKKQYVELLKKFRINFSDSYHQIVDHFEQGDLPEIQNILHKLSGVAGNLSAKHIHKLATETGQMIETNNIKNLSEKFDSLQERMFKAFAEIENIESTNSSPESVIGNNQEQEDWPEQFNKLKTLLKDFDFDAVKYLEEIQNSMINTGLENEFNQIRSEIQNYNFEEALQICESIKI